MRITLITLITLITWLWITGWLWMSEGVSDSLGGGGLVTSLVVGRLIVGFFLALVVCFRKYVLGCPRFRGEGCWVEKDDEDDEDEEDDDDDDDEKEEEEVVEAKGRLATGESNSWFCCWLDGLDGNMMDLESPGCSSQSTGASSSHWPLVSAALACSACDVRACDRVRFMSFEYVSANDGKIHVTGYVSANDRNSSVV